MKLSIVLLSHNGLSLTRQCLQYLLPLLEIRKDVNVCVIDNGSSDNTYHILSHEFSHSQIDFVRLDSNRGVAGGRNRGIARHPDSEYIMFLDNDTIVHVNSVVQLINFMDSHPEVGLAAPSLRGINGNIQLSFKKFPGIKEKILNLAGRKSESPEIDSSELMQPFYVIGACQIFRRSLIDKVGLLDENIFFGPEDADFCIRIRREGYKVVYIPWIKIIHCWQRKSHKNPFSKISRLHIKGLFYFYRKWNRWFK